MKKLSSLLLFLMLLCATVGFAQESEVPVSSASASAQSAAGRATGCQQLKTNQSSSLNNNGLVFNVVARQNIVITSLDNLFSQDSIWVHLYYKNGAYDGGDLQLIWTELDSVFIAHADTTPTRLPILINKPLATADTMAFFIYCSYTSSTGYAGGTAFNNVSVQNTQIKILEGIGVSQSLNKIPTRTFCGNVNYCPQGQALCAEDRYTDNATTNNGVMTDIKANKNITVSSVGVMARTGVNSLILYSRPKTHLGFEADSMAWSKVATVAFPTVQNDSIVMINLPSPLNLDSGNSVGFYFKVVGPGSVKYVSALAKPVTFPSYATELYQIAPATGVAGSFGTNSYPRTFSGGVDACLRSAPNAIHETKSLELRLYPNPANDILNITTDDYETVTLDVIDMQGRVVMATTFQGATTLDVAQLPAAVYQLYLHNANGSAVKRFVKN